MNEPQLNHVLWTPDPKWEVSEAMLQRIADTMDTWRTVHNARVIDNQIVAERYAYTAQGADSLGAFKEGLNLVFIEQQKVRDLAQRAIDDWDLAHEQNYMINRYDVVRLIEQITNTHRYDRDATFNLIQVLKQAKKEKMTTLPLATLMWAIKDVTWFEPAPSQVKHTMRWVCRR